METINKQQTNNKRLFNMERISTNDAYSREYLQQETEKARQFLAKALPEFQRKHMTAPDDAMVGGNEYIPAGALIALGNEVSTVIRWGEVYGFLLDGVPMIRKILPYDAPGCVLCEAANSNYPAFVEKQDNLKGLSRVTAVFIVNHFES